MQDNTKQIEYWNGEAGQKWAQNDTHFERSIGTLNAPLLERARAAGARRALDIGCGCGNQTLALPLQNFRHMGSYFSHFAGDPIQTLFDQLEVLMELSREGAQAAGIIGLQRQLAPGNIILGVQAGSAR